MVGAGQDALAGSLPQSPDPHCRLKKKPRFSGRLVNNEHINKKASHQPLRPSHPCPKRRDRRERPRSRWRRCLPPDSTLERPIEEQERLPDCHCRVDKGRRSAAAAWIGR